MMLKKINAGLSLITTALLINHAGFLSVFMLFGCSCINYDNNVSYLLMVTMMLHAVLSIVSAILGHKGADKIKCKTYNKLNFPTIVQRFTGMLIILLIGMHIAGAKNYFNPKVLHAVLHPLFFTLAFAHTAVSVSKAMITLGIGNAKAVKFIDVFVKVLCGIILVASVFGFYMNLFTGGAG